MPGPKDTLRTRSAASGSSPIASAVGLPRSAPALHAGPAETETDGARRVFRVNHHRTRKPMTLDEALLEMDKDRDYLVYRDAETDRFAVLVRRRDGNFDLVEG